jgi:hypothetical protein
MKTIEVPIDDESYARAEVKAGALATSLPEVVADYLRRWIAGEDGREAARQAMSHLFAQPDWQFGVGVPDSREERNARR